ncbi:MAG: transporter substrate-binding domain-containing protein [Clostridia bacterium]|nr:transporter substrate-binding domain-containing protein [Clostridia bacterium]
MKKLIAVLTALCLVLSLAAAVAENVTTIEAGKLLYSTSPDFPPFEYRDDNDNIVGIEPELMELIAGKLGLTAEAVPMDFDGALLAARVDQGAKVDAVVSGVTVREDRKLIFDFTDTYVSITQAIVSKDGAITEEQLKDVNIGVQSGTTGMIYAEDDYPNVTKYETYSLAFQALQNGQVDCVLLDDMVGNAYVKKLPGLGMQPTSYEKEDFAFGVNKGNTALVEAINAALAELKADGTVDAIIAKYNEAE